MEVTCTPCTSPNAADSPDPSKDDDDDDRLEEMMSSPGNFNIGFNGLMSKSGGNHKKNGDPNYTVVISVKHDPDKDGPMMDIWQKAPPAILAKIKELAGGGGGFTSAGPAAGVYSARAGTVTFVLKCMSAGAYECVKKVKIVCDLLSNTISLYDAVGWCHHHTGEFKLKRGLPPAAKEDVKEILGLHPHIKPSKAVVQMVEQKGWPQQLKRQIITWINNNRQSAELGLGVSAYGTIHKLGSEDQSMNKMLGSPQATIHTPYVLGVWLNEAEQRCLVLYTSILGMMLGYECANSGYTQGLVLSDYTYKFFREKLSMMTIAVADIAQHGKLIAFGPSSHEDAPMTKKAGEWIYEHGNWLVEHIAKKELPEVWSPTLVNAVYEMYITKLDNIRARSPQGVLPLYTFGSVGTDCAQAISNGFIASPLIRSVAQLVEDPRGKIEVTTRRICWVHIIRTCIPTAASKLLDPSKENANLLYEHLALISCCTVSKLKLHMLRWFRKEWAINKLTMTYLENHVLKYPFSRCDGCVGDPNNTNIIERKHLDLQSENYFNTVEGAGTVCLRMPRLGERVFRNTSCMALVPEVSLKSWKKAQKMVSQGWENMGFKAKEKYIFPSEDLLQNHIPEDADTVDKRRQHIKKWVTEYRAMMKNPTSYKKLTDGSWNFELICDMLYSFWELEEIEAIHPRKKELTEAGICFYCTCPQFHHYHECKHSLALGIITKKTTIPTRFSAAAVGKRKAPAGAVVRKRSGALVVDA